MAIDPSAAFRRAIRQQLPRAALSVDAFHLVELGNDIVTRVRQRVTREARAAVAGSSTRLGEPSGSSCAPDTLSARARSRLGDPGRRRSHDQIGTTWVVQKRLRQLLQADTLEHAEQTPGHPGRRRHSGRDARHRPLLATVQASSPTIKVLVVTSITNARTEAANTSIKQIKRSGRGYRNPAHYKARILLASAARRAA